MGDQVVVVALRGGLRYTHWEGSSRLEKGRGALDSRNIGAIPIEMIFSPISYFPVSLNSKKFSITSSSSAAWEPYKLLGTYTVLFGWIRLL